MSNWSPDDPRPPPAIAVASAARYWAATSGLAPAARSDQYKPSPTRPRMRNGPAATGAGLGSGATIGAAARAGANSIGSAASAGALRMPVSPPLAQGEIASACPRRFPSLGNSQGLGTSPTATP